MRGRYAIRPLALLDRKLRLLLECKLRLLLECKLRLLLECKLRLLLVIRFYNLHKQQATPAI